MWHGCRLPTWTCLNSLSAPSVCKDSSYAREPPGGATCTRHRQPSSDECTLGSVRLAGPASSVCRHRRCCACLLGPCLSALARSPTCMHAAPGGNTHGARRAWIDTVGGQGSNVITAGQRDQEIMFCRGPSSTFGHAPSRNQDCKAGHGARLCIAACRTWLKQLGNLLPTRTGGTTHGPRALPRSQCCRRAVHCRSGVVELGLQEPFVGQSRPAARKPLTCQCQ